MGYQTGQNDPDWFDVVRPTKLPAFENEFGEDGHFYAGVRQSRLGVKGFIPTDVGEIKTIFEFELFGTGVDAGQTTFRLRHAWGELGKSSAPARPGARSWTPTCSRTRSSTGDRTAWCSSATSSCAGCRCRAATRASRSRSSGRARAPTRASSRAASSSQDVQGRFPLPDLSAHYRMNAGLGPRPDRRRSCARWSGTTSDSTPVRPVGRRDRLGHQPQLEPQVRSRTRCRLRWSSARASRTT